MVIEMSPRTIEKFKKQGYPISKDSIGLVESYPLPKLDDFHSAVKGKTYEEKREKFLEQVRTFSPGLNEIIYHPSVETEGLKKITNSWQQRVWEERLFTDPVVQNFIKENNIIVTNWKEVMGRFKKMTAKADNKQAATRRMGTCVSRRRAMVDSTTPIATATSTRPPAKRDQSTQREPVASGKASRTTSASNTNNFNAAP